MEGFDVYSDPCCLIDPLTPNQRVESKVKSPTGSLPSNQDSVVEAPPNFSYAELQRHNQELQNEIIDLKCALAVRDAENEQLNQRFLDLKTTVEQQDRVIAEIYAATYCSHPSDPTKPEDASTKTSSHVAVTQARTLLKHHLDTMGFHGEQIGPVLDELTKETTTQSTKKNSKSKCGTRHTYRREVEMLNKILDRLLNLDDAPNRSPIKGRSKSMSAVGSRLSASAYGLLETTEVDEEGQDKENITNVLFKGIPVESSSPGPSSKTSSSTKNAITYAEFLKRLDSPLSRDLLYAIIRFIWSVLGPNKDGIRPNTKQRRIKTEFFGTKDLERRFHAFLQDIEHQFRQHAAWRHASEETLVVVRDGVEKLIMEQIYVVAMSNPVTLKDWTTQDELLLRRMQVLSFVTPDMLDIKQCMRNEILWSVATEELRGLHQVRSPQDKLECIVRSCSFIFSALNLSSCQTLFSDEDISTSPADPNQRPGADDFLPVFIFIVLHSRIPHLYSACEFIAAYRNPADLRSMPGYCLVNLRSAIEFIMVLDHSMLTVDQEVFDKALAKAELEYPNESLTVEIGAPAVGAD